MGGPAGGAGSRRKGQEPSGGSPLCAPLAGGRACPADRRTANQPDLKAAAAGEDRPGTKAEGAPPPPGWARLAPHGQALPAQSAGGAAGGVARTPARRAPWQEGGLQGRAGRGTASTCSHTGTPRGPGHDSGHAGAETSSDSGRPTLADGGERSPRCVNPPRAQGGTFVPLKLPSPHTPVPTLLWAGQTGTSQNIPPGRGRVPGDPHPGSSGGCWPHCPSELSDPGRGCLVPHSRGWTVTQSDLCPPGAPAVLGTGRRNRRPTPPSGRLVLEQSTGPLALRRKQ